MLSHASARNVGHTYKNSEMLIELQGLESKSHYVFANKNNTSTFMVTQIDYNC